MADKKLTAEELANLAYKRGGLSIGDYLFPRTGAVSDPSRKDFLWNAAKDVASLPGRTLYGLASAAVAPFDGQSSRKALAYGLASPTSPGAELSDILEDVVKDPANLFSEGAASLARLAKGNLIARGLARAGALSGADVGTQALNGQPIDWRTPLMAAGTDVVGRSISKLTHGGDIPKMGMYDRPLRHREGGHPIETLLRRNPEGSWRRKNLDDYMRGSDVVGFDGKPIILYHGASGSYPYLKPSADGMYGYGIYTSERPKVAEAYTTAMKGGNAPQMYPMISRAKDLFDFDSPADWERLRRGFPAPNEVERLELLRKMNPNMTNDRVYNSMMQLLDDAEMDALTDPLSPMVNQSSQVLSDRIHAMGHGGLRYKDVGGVPGATNYNYLIFDPADLKSVHNPGTWGKMNPRDLMGFTGSAEAGKPGLASGLVKRALSKTQSRYLDSLKTR